MARVDGPLALRAYAKVNLALEVVGRRVDGYHDLVSVMQTVSLHDDLQLRPSERDAIAVTAPEAWGVPADAENLVLKAIAAYRGLAPDESPRLAAELIKRVPPAGGLGGGSSDAAATLRGLVRWSRRQPAAERLTDLAARLGSDVPFFLRGGTQLAEGRGERLSPLPDLPETWLVLATPPLALERKTARLFRLLEETDFSDGQRTLAMARAVSDGELPDLSVLVNAFDRVAQAAFPELRRYRTLVRDVCGHAALSGAGPALFAITSDRATAEEAAATLQACGLPAQAVRTIAAAESTTIFAAGASGGA